MVCPKVDPEQLLEKEPTGLRVWLGSLALYAQGPGFEYQQSKVKEKLKQE